MQVHLGKRRHSLGHLPRCKLLKLPVTLLYPTPIFLRVLVNLVIFTEPHAYISPKHYDNPVSVPTWNYIAVHTYGQGRLIHDPEESFAILEDTIMAYEAGYKQQWDNLPMDYKLKMQKGIAAFEIEVNDLQAKKKLSQNKTPAEQQRIIQDLTNSGHALERQIADYMQENLIKAKGID
jgi:transcriptional regulator